MSHYDYTVARALERHDLPFRALMMAAMRCAGGDSLDKLRTGWPELWAELQARGHAPGGLLPGEVAADAAAIERAHSAAEQLRLGVAGSLAALERLAQDAALLADHK